jgi:hypothetical protein
MNFTHYDNQLAATGYAADVLRAIARELGQDLIDLNHDVNANWRSWLTRAVQAAPNEAARASLTCLSDLLATFDNALSFEGGISKYESYVTGLPDAKHVMLRLRDQGELDYAAIAATIETPISGFNEVLANLRRLGLLHAFGDEKARPLSLTYRLTSTGYRCAERLKP